MRTKKIFIAFAVVFFSLEMSAQQPKTEKTKVTSAETQATTQPEVDQLVMSAEIFDPTGKELQFKAEKFHKRQGELLLDRTVYKDLNGEVLVEETMTLKNDQLQRYDVEQKQLNQQAWIEVSEKDVIFNLKKPRKNNYPQTYKKPENFVVNPQIVPFIKSHWESLNNGKEERIHLGVWNRQEAIRFALIKDSSSTTEQLVIKMSPTSLIIRAAVAPIYFTFDTQTKNLKLYKGRTSPKMKSGGSFSDYDALTKYQYP